NPVLRASWAAEWPPRLRASLSARLKSRRSALAYSESFTPNRLMADCTRQVRTSVTPPARQALQGEQVRMRRPTGLPRVLHVDCLMSAQMREEPGQGRLRCSLTGDDHAASSGCPDPLWSLWTRSV